MLSRVRGAGSWNNCCRGASCTLTPEEQAEYRWPFAEAGEAYRAQREFVHPQDFAEKVRRLLEASPLLSS
jgi:hypothetical protein